MASYAYHHMGMRSALPLVMTIKPIKLSIIMDRLTIEDCTLAVLWCVCIGCMVAMACSLV